MAILNTLTVGNTFSFSSSRRVYEVIGNTKGVVTYVNPKGDAYSVDAAKAALIEVNTGNTPKVSKAKPSKGQLKRSVKPKALSLQGASATLSEAEVKLTGRVYALEQGQKDIQEALKGLTDAVTALAKAIS